MIYSLPNGKAIEITIEQFLAMTDEDIKYMVARNWGDDISDPFHNSALRETPFEEMEIDDFAEEEVADLTAFDDIEKLCDEEFIDDQDGHY